MIAYTPAELRTLAGSQKTNPFFVSQVSAALTYAADALDAADKALQAELARAIAQPVQPAVTTQIPEIPVIERQAEPMRKHVEAFAKCGGWVSSSGEGAFEYVQRISYEQGLKDGYMKRVRPELIAQIPPVAQAEQEPVQPLAAKKQAPYFAERLNDFTCNRLENVGGAEGFTLFVTTLGRSEPYQLYGHEALALWTNLGIALGQLAQPVQPTIKQSLTVAEQSAELDTGMAAQHYCRGLWGAARGHSDWRKVHEHFASGYKQGRYDELQVQGPSPWPDDAPKANYKRGYGVALSDAEEAINDECRERVVTASDCIELIRNLGAAPQPAQLAVHHWDEYLAPEMAKLMYRVEAHIALDEIKNRRLARQDSTSPIAQPEQPAADNALSNLLFQLDSLAGNGMIPWQIEDAFADYQAAINPTGGTTP